MGVKYFSFSLSSSSFLGVNMTGPEEFIRSSYQFPYFQGHPFLLLRFFLLHLYSLV